MKFGQFLAKIGAHFGLKSRPNGEIFYLETAEIGTFDVSTEMKLWYCMLDSNLPFSEINFGKIGSTKIADLKNVVFKIA